MPIPNKIAERPKSLIAGCALLLAACGGGDGPGPDPAPLTPPLTQAPDCGPNFAPITLTGSVTSVDAKTYAMQPFRVVPGTGRIELSYGWTENSPLPSLPGVGGFVATTLDLGLWDQRGYRSVEGFRGWSGSRQGRIDREQPPVFVQADSADRGYIPARSSPASGTRSSASARRRTRARTGR